ASATCGPTYDNWIVKDLSYITTTADITITGAASGHRAGYDISVGNLNNDAYDDVIIGAPFANGNRGQVSVVYGRDRAAFPDTIPLDSQANVTVVGAALDTWLGASVQAGDVNNDNIDDLFMGAIAIEPDCADDPLYPGCGANAPANGAAYALFGGSLSSTVNLGSGNPANLTILGGSADDWLGRGLAVADLDNNNFNEIIVGAAGVDFSGRTDTGAVYIINLPPTAGFTCTTCTIGEGLPLAFTSTTIGNGPFTYSWSFGDGAVASSSPTSHAYADNGIYTATLTVQDTSGLTDTTQHLVTITNRAPVIQSVTNPSSRSARRSVTRPVASLSSPVPSPSLPAFPTRIAAVLKGIPRLSLQTTP
ncbi:MAG: FG-GAP repeat protein, partial [Chloroflexi bacterium]|nr:FG-GAP repeat protein [Chloroflexota bacterium]